MTQPAWLERAFQRSFSCSWMIGFVLNEYCQQEKITHEELAEILVVDLQRLKWLFLCRRPTFLEDLEKIATRFDVCKDKFMAVYCSNSIPDSSLIEQ